MYTIRELLDGYRNKQFSPVEIATAYVSRSQNDNLNAYITVTEEIALMQAKLSERRWQEGKPRILDGIPLSYKDNIYACDIRATSGSLIDKDFIPKNDAPVITTLNEAGAIMIGKANLHEFAFGITNNNPFYGPAKNPWNPELIPGGSSGGSAVSVAANLAAASIGTDTGGSVRIPAASCGLVGMKPTKGLLSGQGTTPLSWTLDHIGPIARDIDDLTILMTALTNMHLVLLESTDLTGLKIGIPINFFKDQVEDELLAFYTDSALKLEKLGAELIEVEVPGAEEAMELTFTIAITEAAYVHRKNIEMKFDQFGDDVKQIMESSKSIPEQGYINAMKRRADLSDLLKNTFQDIDVLLTPTLPVEPKPIGQEVVEINGKKEPIFDCMNRLTNYFNVTGYPALTIPIGMSSKGLPVGIQMAANQMNDALLLRTAKVYEKEYLDDFYQKRTEVLSGVVEN